MSIRRAACLAGLAATLPLAGCSAPVNTAELGPEAAFHLDLSKRLCGETLTGRVVSTQAVDADWRAKDLTLGPVGCTSDALAPDMPERDGDAVMVLPLAVGEDRSRIWTLRFEPDGQALEFRHYHYEPDGSPSPVTSYGGEALPGGTATEQRFPADAATRANFTANGIARSNPNIWTLSLDPAAGTLTYALARPATDTDEARDFRAVFELD